MKRSSFLAALAAIPFIGALLKKPTEAEYERAIFIGGVCDGQDRDIPFGLSRLTMYARVSGEQAMVARFNADFDSQYPECHYVGDGIWATDYVRNGWDEMRDGSYRIVMTPKVYRAEPTRHPLDFKARHAAVAEARRELERAGVPTFSEGAYRVYVD